MFDIRDMVNDVLKLQLEQAQSHNNELVAIFENIDTPDIFADMERIQQVILNLQSNALKFTNNGKVSIIVRIDESLLKIRVQDTGVGIASSEIDKLFNLFGKL